MSFEIVPTDQRREWRIVLSEQDGLIRPVVEACNAEGTEPVT
jgi:hypothetical protein